jgi:hypothetical protein
LAAVVSGLNTTFDSTQDANGSVSSGSVHVIGSVGIPNGANSFGIRQCISGIVAGTT